MRLSKAEIKNILDTYSNGLSLNDISNSLNKSKTTIYYHTRKHFGRKIKLVNFNENLKEEFGEVLGVFIGDGSFYLDRNFNYTLRITLSIGEMDYAVYLCNLIEKVFGKTANIWVYRKYNVIYITFLSKVIYKIIKKYVYWKGRKSHSVHLINPHNLDNKILKGIIRGLIASDGSVYVPKNRISFGSVSKKMCLQFSEILNIFGVKSYIYPVHYKNKKTLYHLHITGKENIKLFKQQIDLTEPNRKLKLDRILERRL